MDADSAVARYGRITRLRASAQLSSRRPVWTRNSEFDTSDTGAKVHAEPPSSRCRTGQSMSIELTAFDIPIASDLATEITPLRRWSS